MGKDDGVTPVHGIELEELAANPRVGPSIIDGNLDVIKNLRVRLEVVLGEAEMSVGELFSLAQDSVIKLDREVTAPVDVLLDGKVIARGDLVVADDNFGIRIRQIGE